MMRFPAKGNMLQFLRQAGIRIGTVLDVGAQTGTPELRLLLPDARHILFEPASDFHADLARNYETVDHEIAPVALSDRDGAGRLRKSAIEGGAITHAAIAADDDLDGTDAVAISRLDSFMAGRSDPKPYLLKIDIDGGELAVLGGAAGIWPDVACVIVEATMATLSERLNAVTSRGFRLFDIVDQCYYHGILSQVDLVLLAEPLFSNPELNPWQNKPFAWTNWIPIAHFEDVVQAAVRKKPIYQR